MKAPSLVPEEINARLGCTGLWDIDPVNLFRITWKNEPTEAGGLFGPPNYIELPSQLTGVRARIIALVGKWFPRVVQSWCLFGCLVPPQVTGQFDSTCQKAVWPSTGNTAGAALSIQAAGRLFHRHPPRKSRERFQWLEELPEIIATGLRSNVKKYSTRLTKSPDRPDCVIFNQFEEMGSHLWHYE